MDADLSSLPDDIDALKAALIAARAEAAVEKANAAAIGAELAHVRATAANDRSLIAHLKLEIEKLRRVVYGPRSERTSRLLDQLVLQLEEAEADATEDELAAERAPHSTSVKFFERKRPSRKPFPDHLPRERVVELCRKIGDGVNQAADLISATASIPSLNFIPLTTFGNWF